MSSISRLAVGLAAFAFAFASYSEGTSESAVIWSYSGDGGPERWGDLSEEFFACSKGKAQSPIDIAKTLEADLPAIELSYRGETTEIINDGHTIQVKMGSGNNMRLGEQVYRLTQFHIHSPSEHRIAGEAFPLEAHFVHENATGEIAVVAVMFRLGSRHEGLASLWEHVPRKAGHRRSLVQPIQGLGLVPEGLDHFRYSGSLTTPPCSEGITWLVLKETSTFAPEQVARFIELIGDDSRPLQSLNGRILLH